MGLKSDIETLIGAAYDAGGNPDNRDAVISTYSDELATAIKNYIESCSVSGATITGPAV